MEAVATYDQVIDRFDQETEPWLRVRVIRVLFEKANSLSSLGRFEEALAAYDEVVERCDAEPRQLRIDTHRALRSKGLLLDTLGRSDEEIIVYEQILNRFGNESAREYRSRALEKRRLG
jgi:tetratricopeptide (TPR) repeat protein